MCQSLFFNKVAGLRPTTLLKIRLWHRCFPMNFTIFLKRPFLTLHFRWLLLEIRHSEAAVRRCSSKQVSVRKILGFIEKRLQHRYILVNIAKFLRSFFIVHLQWLPLDIDQAPAFAYKITEGNLRIEVAVLIRNQYFFQSLFIIIN